MKYLESYDIEAKFENIEAAVNFVSEFEATKISFGSIQPTKGLTNEPTEKVIYISNVYTGYPIIEDLENTIKLIEKCNGSAEVIQKEEYDLE